MNTPAPIPYEEYKAAINGVSMTARIGERVNIDLMVQLKAAETDISRLNSALDAKTSSMEVVMDHSRKLEATVAMLERQVLGLKSNNKKLAQSIKSNK